MGVLEFIRTLGPRTSPKKVEGTSYAAVATQLSGKVGKANATLYRNWAEHSELVFAAVHIRRTQVSSAPWSIVPFDDDKPFSETLLTQVHQLLDRPNARLDSFRSFIEPVIEDIIVLDAGCIEKVRNLRGQVVQLWPVDGATIKVSATWDGSPTEPRYFWYPDWQERAQLLNSDMLYIMSNPRSYSAIGLSALETLRLVIDSELNGTDYNRRQVLQAAPDGLLDLGEGAKPEDVAKFKSYFESELSGKGTMGFIGNTKNAKFIPFHGNNRDMQFLEWQQYLARKIAIVLGLSPQDLGLTSDVNRSTAESQDEHTEDRGLRPLMALLQDYITREIVWDEGFGGPDNNLAFRFDSLNLNESLARAQIDKLALAGIPWKSVNEARQANGLPRLGTEYDKLIAMSPQGVVSLEGDIPTPEEMVDAKKPAPAATAAPVTPASRPGKPVSTSKEK